MRLDTLTDRLRDVVSAGRPISGSGPIATTRDVSAGKAGEVGKDGDGQARRQARLHAILGGEWQSSGSARWLVIERRDDRDRRHGASRIGDLADVLEQAGVLDDAAHVWFIGADKLSGKHTGDVFGASIPLSKAMDRRTLLADEMNGVPLTPDHGAPLRVIVPGYIGARSVKWLREIRLEREPTTDLSVFGLDVSGRSSRVTVAATPIDVAGRADILSVHLALAPETKGLIGAELLSRLKPGAIFVNTARAEVVDYDALESAVRERGVRVGLDVFRNEPSAATGTYADALIALPGVYGTHHIGASTEQAQEAIAAETVRIVRAFAETGQVPNVVNLARRTPATHRLIVRHHDRRGVLAHVFYTLGQAGINVEEMENIIYEGAHAACARIQLDEPASDENIKAIRLNADVLSVQVTTIQRKRP